MIINDDKLGWEFHIEEVSAGVYQVRGSDEMGRSVEKQGTNLDVLLAECKEAAFNLSTGPGSGEPR